ncbi:endonuclease/exonuclease/phosphatase family protein [Micromonospora wenchangensis]|uniref:endonuclease/exonuclease/phosphatase family protein n=1 Tax=Micromonospora wenchangensis TaxID=1185415 RepID=UPI003D73776C
MSVELDLSLFNFEAGGLQPDGTYNFAPLARAFLDRPHPDLLMLCEAKLWNARGRRPLHTAMAHLADVTGRPYVGELHTGALATAVIYDPRVLRLDAAEEPEFPDKRNLTRFSLRTDPTYRLHVYVEHWPYADPEQRLARARLLATSGTSPTPTLIAGDLNSTSSGPHLPTPDWTTIPTSTRDHKARHHNGTWHADTRAIDRLIGTWNTTTNQRVNSAGFHHLAELDPHTPTPLPPTTNGPHGLHIDYLLANHALLNTATVVPGTYQIHIPPDNNPATWPSDHRRISCTLRIHPTPQHNPQKHA